MRIGLDAMGGDYAPKAVVEGAILAQKELSKEEQINYSLFIYCRPDIYRPDGITRNLKLYIRNNQSF